MAELKRDELPSLEGLNLRRGWMTHYSDGLEASIVPWVYSQYGIVHRNSIARSSGFKPKLYHTLSETVGKLHNFSVFQLPICKMGAMIIILLIVPISQVA